MPDTEQRLRALEDQSRIFLRRIEKLERGKKERVVMGHHPHTVYGPGADPMQHMGENWPTDKRGRPDA